MQAAALPVRCGMWMMDAAPSPREEGLIFLSSLNFVVLFSVTIERERERKESVWERERKRWIYICMDSFWCLVSSRR